MWLCYSNFNCIFIMWKPREDLAFWMINANFMESCCRWQSFLFHFLLGKKLKSDMKKSCDNQIFQRQLNISASDSSREQTSFKRRWRTRRQSWRRSISSYKDQDQTHWSRHCLSEDQFYPQFFKHKYCHVFVQDDEEDFGTGKFAKYQKMMWDLIEKPDTRYNM